LHTKKQKFRIDNKQCKELNAIAIASGYADRDPQGETSDESFFQVLF